MTGALSCVSGRAPCVSRRAFVCETEFVECIDLVIGGIFCVKWLPFFLPVDKVVVVLLLFLVTLLMSLEC